MTHAIDKWHARRLASTVVHALLSSRQTTMHLSVLQLPNFNSNSQSQAGTVWQKYELESRLDSEYEYLTSRLGWSSYPQGLGHRQHTCSRPPQFHHVLLHILTTSSEYSTCDVLSKDWCQKSINNWPVYCSANFETWSFQLMPYCTADRLSASENCWFGDGGAFVISRKPNERSMI